MVLVCQRVIGLLSSLMLRSWRWLHGAGVSESHRVVVFTDVENQAIKCKMYALYVLYILDFTGLIHAA